MNKISLLVGAGIGYVFGTRAGRQQYDRMAAEAKRVWSDPRVQRKARQAQDTATDLGQKAGGKVSSKVEERTGGSHSSNSSGTTTTGGTTTGEMPLDGHRG